MKLYQCLDRIEDNVLSNSDRQGKSANPLFTKKAIVNALETSLWDYSQTTLGIEGIKTYVVETKQQRIAAPSDRVRSQQYRSIAALISSRWYLLRIETEQYIKDKFFTNTLSSTIPTCVSIWEDEITIKPIPSFPPVQNTLNGAITAQDTEITLTDATGFMTYGGRVHINDEVISYERLDGNILKQCRRGLESTVASAHSNLDAVKLTNFWIYYNKKHWEIPMLSSTKIDPSYLTKEMEINDVHMPAIINEASYQLLCRVDMQRAQLYRADYKEFLQKAKWDIQAGQANQNVGSEVRAPYFFETERYGSQIL